MTKSKLRLSVVVLLLLLMLWPIVLDKPFYLDLACLALISVILALGLNIFFGHAGQINFGAAGFYAIGAYTASLIPAYLQVPSLLGILAAPVAGGITALMLSFPLLRLRGHGLAVGTFGFAHLVYMIADIWADFTGGGTGIKTVSPVIFGYSLRGTLGVYYFVLFMSVASFVLCSLLTRSHFGRALKTIRNDEVVAVASGINVLQYKTIAFVMNGLLGGLAGGLLSLVEFRISPGFFYATENIRQIFMVVLGGMGVNAGAAMGGIFATILPELLWNVQEYFIIIYGLILIIIIRAFPSGLWGIVTLMARCLGPKGR